MRTERGSRSIGIGANALASSIVLVCRPRAADAPTATRREFVTALKAELPMALAHLQRGNIAPVDLAQAAIGPGMAVYRRGSGKQLVLAGGGQKILHALGSGGPFLPSNARQIYALVSCDGGDLLTRRFKVPAKLSESPKRLHQFKPLYFVREPRKIIGR